MTPSKSELAALREKIEAVRHLTGAAATGLTINDIPRALVILGSPRCGSSWLFHLLSETGAFSCPQGEETPFYRANGLGWVTIKENSDAIRVPVDESVRQSVFALLCEDLGRADASVDLLSPSYLAQCARRLLLQWPSLGLTPEQVLECVRESARSAPGESAHWLNLLAKLGLETGFYDLPGVKSRNLQLEIPDYVIEEPPFIVQQARPAITAEDLQDKPLLLKTSTNAYRVPWLKTLLPRTQLRFLVLARNPAASINGLIDGWLSNAFHSHNLQFVQQLKIRGYSDSIPYGDRWWKFDLPPGWTDFDDAPLPDVCAFQWRSAYESIFGATTSADRLHVQYEDLLSPTSFAATVKAVLDFAGVKGEIPDQRNAMQPVMASRPPRATRWRQREKEILPLLQNRGVRALAEKLGYDLARPEALP